MRCALGDKKLKKYSDKYGIRFVAGLVRGNTNHRVDLFDENNNEYESYPDGCLVKVEYLNTDTGTTIKRNIIKQV